MENDPLTPEEQEALIEYYMTPHVSLGEFVLGAIAAVALVGMLLVPHVDSIISKFHP